jgi:hypothetical protein
MSETTAPKRLTGPELIAMVDSMPTATKSDLVRATGYIELKADGSERRLFTEFYEALLTAGGQSLPGAGPRPERPLSFKTTVLSHGGLLVGKRYVEALGLEPGDTAAIAVEDGRVALTPAS